MFHFVAALIGIAIISQAEINKFEFGRIGQASTLVINSTLVLIGIIGLFYSKNRELNLNLSLRWWSFIPAICGIAIIALTPVVIASLGTGIAFCIIVSSQIVCGFLIDIFIRRKDFDFASMAAVSMILICVVFLGLRRT